MAVCDRDFWEAMCHAVCNKTAVFRPGGAPVSPLRDPLGCWHEVTTDMEGDEEESSGTRGLDFFKPYQSAAHSWRIDVKASSDNKALSRSHHRRWRPSCAQSACHNAHQRCCVWSTTNASLISRAHTTERCGSPGPEVCAK
jgi:hypothetical protein